MAIISGNLSNDSRVVIVDESNWLIEYTGNKPAGSFEISGLSVGSKTVIARDSNGESLGYGNVTAV